MFSGIKKLASLVLLVAASTSNALEITGPVYNSHTGYDHYRLDGEFDNESAMQLKVFLRTHKTSGLLVIEANSIGGNARDAASVMRAVRHHGRVVWLVKKSDICTSMCAFVGVGAHRVYGEMGFHGVYSPSDYKNAVGTMSFGKSNSSIAFINRRVREELIAIGISPEDAHLMINTPPDRLAFVEFSGNPYDYKMLNTASAIEQ